MSSNDVKTRYPGVRVRSNSIQIDFNYRGIRCRETLAIPTTPVNVKKAADLRGRIRHDIAFNQFNYMDYFPESVQARKFGTTLAANTTIADAIDWWWAAQKQHHRRKTIDNYENDIRNHIRPGIGHIMLRDITTRVIKDWINAKELAVSTKNNILIPLRKMFAEAYSEGYLDEDIMRRIPALKKMRREKEPFKPAEVDSILALLAEPFRSFYQFSFWTGLSTGEQIGLNGRTSISIATSSMYGDRYQAENIWKRPRTKHAIVELNFSNLLTRPYLMLCQRISLIIVRSTMTNGFSKILAPMITGALKHWATRGEKHYRN